MLAKVWKSRKSLYLFSGKKIDVATMKNNVGVPQNSKIELPYNIAISLLDTEPKKIKLICQKDNSFPYSLCYYSEQ